jgi:uncharacterized membrane protein YcaP (DUF421 family)
LIAAATVLRAIIGYLFLILIVRIVGRRPGKQLSPFEFVLIFYLGGLMLTAMVREEVSITNAFTQIMAIALTHYLLAYLRTRSNFLGEVLDGTPLLLMEGGHWRARTKTRMRIEDEDVMEMARDQGLRSLREIDTAVLERSGEISIVPLKKK